MSSVSLYSQEQNNFALFDFQMFFQPFTRCFGLSMSINVNNTIIRIKVLLSCSAINTLCCALPISVLCFYLKGLQAQTFATGIPTLISVPPPLTILLNPIDTDAMGKLNKRRKTRLYLLDKSLRKMLINEPAF